MFIPSGSSLTNRIIPRKPRSTSFLLSILSSRVALISAARWIGFGYWDLVSGNDIQSWAFFITTTARVQSMWGFSFESHGIPRIICLFILGKTRAKISPLYPPHFNLSWTHHSVLTTIPSAILSSSGLSSASIFIPLVAHSRASM